MNNQEIDSGLALIEALEKTMGPEGCSTHIKEGDFLEWARDSFPNRAIATLQQDWRKPNEVLIRIENDNPENRLIQSIKVTVENSIATITGNYTPLSAPLRKRGLDLK